ncbi:MAG: hypothetical protein OEW19_22735, partial [Acidobacteriota bacterium]|nr:hypothetical protein [Acidobacteriota bacterium]
VISRVKALLGMTGTPQTPQTRLVTASVAASVRGEPAVSAAGAARASMATTELPTRGHGDLWRSEEPAPTGMPNVIEESSGMAPIDDVIDAFETRSQEPSAVASVAPATADARSPEHLATSHANRVGGAGAPAVVTAARPAPPTADVFETLLAAEQGDPLALDARLGSFDVPAAAPEMTDETLEALAERVSRKLHEPLSAGLRDIVVRTVQDGMATEARAAVAEAVQAAVDGTILGTLRGSVNEAVAAAVPAAVEQQVTGVLRESAERALSGAVGQAVRDTVAAQAAGMVRETVEREMRDGVAPLVQQLVREVVGDTLRQVVTNALAASVPAAMAEAVRSEAAGHIREVVHETSERLVREEIARIRERHG